MDLGPADELDDIDVAFERGHPDALKAAYDAHGPLVFSYCSRALGADLARDITQETFLAAWRAREQFAPARGSLAGWIMGIAKNKIVDQHRRNGRRVSTVGGVDVIDVASVDEDTAAMADRMLVAEAIETLPERARTVVEMAFFEDLTHAEIATRTDLPLGTIKSDIRRGLARMRRHLEDQQ